MAKERLIRALNAELRELRPHDPNALRDRSGLSQPTINRILAGLPVQRASLKLALDAARCIIAERAAQVEGGAR